MEKAAKKSQVHLFLSLSGVDILESKTKVCYKHVVVSLQHMVQWHVLLSLVSGLIPCLPCVQFLLYTCPLSTVSFCAVLPSSPKVFGFVAQHPAADMNHCYLFQSTKFVSIPRNNGCAVPVLVKWDIQALVLVLMRGFSWTLQSHVLVSLIGDAFQASKKQERTVGARDLIVEALRHKVSSSVWPTIKVWSIESQVSIYLFICPSVVLLPNHVAAFSKAAGEVRC